MALAPDRLLVAARIDLADGLSADEIERASSEIDRELRERIPTVWQVFLDATPRAARWRRRRKTGRERPAPERAPHRLACQKAISPPAGVATTLRQPAGPSRASSRTAAPRSRARSVAAPISDTST